MKTPNIMITMTSLPNIEIARSIAQRCIETHLAACVQIIPQIESIYFWDNQLRTDSETLILIKTNSDKKDMLEQELKLLHPYDGAVAKLNFL